MARAYEPFDSREGESSGVLGTTFAPRTIRVECDSGTDDPLSVLQTLPIQDGGLRLGMKHPTRELVLLQFVRSRRLSGRVVEYVVLYGPAIFFPSAQPWWEIQLFADTTTQEYYNDLDGMPFGHPEFQLIDPSSIPSGMVLFDALGRDFKPIVLGLPQNYNPKTAPVYARPHVGDSGSGMIRLSRHIPSFPNFADTYVAARGKINSDDLSVQIGPNKTVKIAPKLHLKIRDISFNQTTGTLVGQDTPGIIYQMSVTIQYSEIPYHPFQLGIKYVDTETGTESVVRQRSDGKPLVQNFRNHAQISFTALFDSVNVGRRP